MKAMNNAECVEYGWNGLPRTRKESTVDIRRRIFDMVEELYECNIPIADEEEYKEAIQYLREACK